MEDLWELAWGIIAAEDALSVSEVIEGTWKAQVRGLSEKSSWWIIGSTLEISYSSVVCCVSWLNLLG
jgi:hypothetical protein